MSTPSAPSAPSAPAEDTSSDEVFLGPGAWGDVAKPDLTRAEYIEDAHPETEPCNPTSDPDPITGPEGSAGASESDLPPADGGQAQALSTPAGTANANAVDQAAPATDQAPAAPASS